MSVTFHSKTLLWVTTALLLTGCASLQQPPYRVLTTQQRQQQLAKLQQWRLQGVVSVRAQRRTHIVYVNWQQWRHHYQLHIAGPLNIDSIQIDGTPQRVTLRRGSQQKISAATPEQLLDRQLGWALPLSNLYYWIRSLPVPHQPVQLKEDRYGHIIALKQNGWWVNYGRYRRYGALDLPTHLMLQSPQLRIKIIIRQWHV